MFTFLLSFHAGSLSTFQSRRGHLTFSDTNTLATLLVQYKHQGIDPQSQANYWWVV